MRPNDTLARYGGEEFLILLPDTHLDDAVNALTRLQRELTKKFSLTNNQKLLITFSAGVTAVGEHEDRTAAFKRADAAMYEAKKAGKNRVVST
jgi:diguanylate cyclase